MCGSPAASLKAQLEGVLRCPVSDDPLIRDYYSADASLYRVRPRVVVFPKTEQDVQETVMLALECGLSIVPRGAGTGLVGGALGRHIVMDLKGMDKISVGNRTVTVGSGVNKGVLDGRLAAAGKFLSPDPSVGRYCSIGGMIGTNASGIHALKYGSVIDNIRGIVMVDGRGQRIRLPRDVHIGGRILEIASRTDLSRFPHTSKNSCGYRLDSVRHTGEPHRVVAGSEGTLGVVVSARFRTHDLPANRCLAVISYVDIDNVERDVNQVLELRPSAVEYLDKHTISNTGLFGFSERTAAVLFVEFDCRPDLALRRMRRIVRGRVESSTYRDKEIRRWWDRRNSALAYSLMAAAGDPVPHIIEDTAVPVQKLGTVFKIVEWINTAYGGCAIVYGHAGDGNLHVRLVMRNHSSKALRGMASLFFTEIRRNGGTITAEHGDGIARSWFVRRQYGDRNYQLFRELKNLMDPHGIMNPGKIIARTRSGKPQ